MKKLLYILILGIILCTFASSDKVLEQGLSIRNIIWTVLTLILFFVISSRVSVNYIDGKHGIYGHTYISSLIFLIYLAFILITAISLFRAINVTEGYYEVGRVLVSLVFLYGISTILYEQENKDKLVKSLVILALVIGAYGVYEYFMVTFSRRLGFMSNRNLWSAAHLLLLPFCFYGLSFSKRWRYLCIFAGILLLFNIVTLMTRSVWVSLIVSSIVTLIIFRKLPKLRVIVLAFVIVGLFLHIGGYKRRIRGTLSTESLSLRSQTWKKTLQMSRDNFLLGVGAGNWKINIAKYGNEYPAQNGMRGERFFLRPHNDYMWTLSETGVIGFSLYATIFLMSLYYAYKSRNMAMFFGILCYMGFAFFSFPKERVSPSLILLVMIAMVIPKKKVICLSPQLVFSTGALVVVLLVFTTALYIGRYKTEEMICKVLAAREQKDWQKVINIIDDGYSRYSTIDPIFATPIINYRAEGYLFLDNYRQAFEDYKRAYRYSPYHIYIIANLATCYAVNGFTEEAIGHYEKALAITPSFEAAKKNINSLRGKL